MNNRERMRASNKRVREWLLEHGYDDIWFKAHSAKNDLVTTRYGKYWATDLWNLFDGICFDRYGDIVFLQMKTNGWAKEKPIELFLQRRNNLKVLVLNVTNVLKECNGKWIVKVREYQ